MAKVSKSAGAYFPFQIDNNTTSLKRATTISSMIRSSVLLFLLTPPYSRLANKTGSILYTLKHSLIPSRELPDKEEQIQRELTTNFPGVIFQVQLEQKGVDLILKIQFGTEITNFDTITIPITFNE